MVRQVYIVPSESSHVEYPKVRSHTQLESWPDTVTNPIAPLGRRLESWPDTLATGQAVRGTGLS